MVAQVVKQRHGEHGLAQLVEKNTQAEELILRERGIQVIGYGRDGGVHLTWIQKTHPDLFYARRKKKRKNTAK